MSWDDNDHNGDVVEDQDRTEDNGVSSDDTQSEVNSDESQNADSQADDEVDGERELTEEERAEQQAAEEAQAEEDEAVDALSEEDEYEVEDSGPVGLGWEHVRQIILFINKLKKSERYNQVALSQLILGAGSDDNGEPIVLNPLVVAEKISEDTPRSEIASYIGSIFLDRISGDESREKLFAQFNWANEMDDETRRGFGPVLTALCASFVKKEEKKDDEGNVVRDESGEPILVGEPYVAKRTTRGTPGSDILSMLEEGFKAIDQDRLKEFFEWYQSIVTVWPGVADE